MDRRAIWWPHCTRYGWLKLAFPLLQFVLSAGWRFLGELPISSPESFLPLWFFFDSYSSSAQNPNPLLCSSPFLQVWIRAGTDLEASLPSALPSDPLRQAEPSIFGAIGSASTPTSFSISSLSSLRSSGLVALCIPSHSPIPVHLHLLTPSRPSCNPALLSVRALARILHISRQPTSLPTRFRRAAIPPLLPPTAPRG